MCLGTYLFIYKRVVLDMLHPNRLLKMYHRAHEKVEVCKNVSFSL